MHTLTWHGHSNFQIATPSANIVIDPFFTGNPSAATPWDGIARPDAVFVTHDHGDHVGQAVDICNATGAMLGAIVGTTGKLVAAGLPQSQVLNGIGYNIGGTVTVGKVGVTMTQAFHSSDSGAPVGYILTLDDGFTIYHAGDTGIFSGMKLWGRLYDIDLALLPIGGVFTMDARQAALACSLLKCRGVVPMHWGTFPVLEQNTQAFRDALKNFAPDCRLFDMAPGETLSFSKLPEGDCGCE
ncbi:metal-dependent hydrolase [Desulfovibrio subterraneus]|jgi:L-ascorbate metabolism protein UlaG (beta-lactamase superfamily)|uniref:UPF0173 metal-dependent hydrolase DSM101010T_36650 n=1 Tax=Desulfovibrio subterraneus TaxID=2718620 RepID=A0A7J0BNQ3_9BACT|nr:metal-dependent hydrolase [Desulfovibrio subterraneus]WBF69217.1 metal-dependent hydrolase [Desulfovibrio subterraneus]GFM35300.1 UPF0173 metal-dependent hydrolase [Desulfovibrio subterraneus]